MPCERRYSTIAAVIAEAVSAYVAASAAASIVGAHEQLVAALERERDRSSQLYEAGATPRVAVLRAEAALGRARAELETAREGWTVAIRRLARASGVPVARLEAGGLVAVTAAGEPEPDSGLVARAVEENPEVARARSRAAAAESVVGAARSGFLPRVALTGRYSAYGSTATAPDPEWNAGVQVSWPLFTGGARARVVGVVASARHCARR